MPFLGLQFLFYSFPFGLIHLLIGLDDDEEDEDQNNDEEEEEDDDDEEDDDGDDLVVEDDDNGKLGLYSWWTSPSWS